ncbi:Hsp70 family protein [Prosthecochloris sp. SCSIO W1101]|uniref:FISUMP domain-containing protein n=1 Tax=Prosthecochloris sp. SCSIO W1101 TaxID=2992242 RepID=UPI00223C9B54|nr:Hsp70 family protein [Prosthecochloris sp. SCSIO W1101]UZJ40279.1 Hsp70 family protein [Prosthecochloris sp. SCSIO W1101]
MHIIGIDFGTSYTTAAWLNPKTGLPEPIRFLDNGQEKLPSLVYYGIEETLVGEAALHMLQEVNNYPEDERIEIQASIVCSLKRRMDAKGIHVLPHQTEPVSHVEIIKDIFAKIRDEAERAVFGGETVKGCVITHPVVFSEIKKNMLRDGASKAGFEQVELIEEPIAAAKGYVASGAKVGSGILVYDFGGGTFDVAYVSKDEKGIYRTPVDPDGDDCCGGDDLDDELYRYWERIVQETHKRRISSGNGVVDLTFLMRCRRHKESLTRQTKAAFRETLPPPGNIRMKLELDRATLNQLIRPYIDRTVQKTKSLLKRVKEKGYEVDTVVLVGGSSKIPLVREQLQKILPIEPLETMHVDVAVAMGAAVHRQEEPDPIADPVHEPVVITESRVIKQQESSVTDIDGNTYRTVKIGKQVWMAENLSVAHYRNGEVIPQIQDDEEWISLITGAWCYYENNKNYNEYGRLYNWYAVKDSRGLAPEGWHVPSDEEWKLLERYLGMSEEDISYSFFIPHHLVSMEFRSLFYEQRGGIGGLLKETGIKYWAYPNEGATNMSGFTALASGGRFTWSPWSHFQFRNIGHKGSFWSSSEAGENSISAWFRELRYNNTEVAYESGLKIYGLTVRCVRD